MAGRFERLAQYGKRNRSRRYTSHAIACAERSLCYDPPTRWNGQLGDHQQMLVFITNASVHRNNRFERPLHSRRIEVLNIRRLLRLCRYKRGSFPTTFVLYVPSLLSASWLSRSGRGLSRIRKRRQALLIIEFYRSATRDVMTTKKRFTTETSDVRGPLTLL